MTQMLELGDRKLNNYNDNVMGSSRKKDSMQEYMGSVSREM